MDYSNKPFQELFDDLFPMKGILSIWGDYGVGKTTFSLQKAIDYGLRKKVLYIYTKPNFPNKKIQLLIQKSAKRSLNNIMFIQSLDFGDLYVLIFNLEFIILDAIKKSKNIDLIVVDSITNLYRLELTRDSKEKNFLLNFKLNQILANLFLLNEKYNIDILIVSNMTNINKNGEIIEVQSGGNVMDYWINNSIRILRTNKLNLRKFIYEQKNNNEVIESFSILTENGFMEFDE